MNILFFIDSLVSGGRERRMLELLFYLKKHTDYKLALVLTEDTIDYPYVHDLKIPIHIIKRRFIKYDPSLFWKFYKIAKDFNPDIIHTWGTMTTWYAAPSKRLFKCKLYSNLVANTNPPFKGFGFSRLLFRGAVRYADRILSNSQTGLEAYCLSDNPKAKTIYNGVRMERFQFVVNKEKLKQELQITTPYIAIMVASTTDKKDYDLLINVAEKIYQKRTDITHLAIGSGPELERLKKRVYNDNVKNIYFLGERNDVEQLVFIADIGLLFSPSEGVSNAIIEYMALAKPVITTDTKGGSREVIEEGKSGYIMHKDIDKIVGKVEKLLGNPELRTALGNRGKKNNRREVYYKEDGRGVCKTI